MSTPDHWQICISCGYRLPRDAFSTTAKSGRDISRPRAVCIPCEEEHRTSRKRADRWYFKAKATLRSHAKKLGVTREELADIYGWDPRRIARDLERANAHECVGCNKPFAQMPNGIQDITVDIIVREAAPVYGTNTQILCQTCNRRKGMLTQIKHSAIQLAYRIRNGGQPDVGRLFEMPQAVALPVTRRDEQGASTGIAQVTLFP